MAESVPPPTPAPPPPPSSAPSTTTTLPAPPPSPTTTAPAPATGEDAFWRRLADCECASGSCGGRYISYFQFSPDTAAKVGIDGTEPYEEQRAAAEEWARRIHPREGTSAGWPVCWWRAAA